MSSDSSSSSNNNNDAAAVFAFYRYDPSMAGAVIFTILFAITTIWHIVQLCRTQTWFFIPFVSHAILRKKWLTKVFVTGDVLSFFLQGAGGGIQSSGSLSGMQTGEHIIVAGLFVQIFFFGFFMLTAGAFDRKLKKYPIPRCRDPSIPWRKHLNILYLTSFLIMVRSVFRLIEYLQGNDGYLLHHEVFLYLFDAVLIFSAMAVFNFFHPSEITQLLGGGGDYELQGGGNKYGV
ncbi:hypothetical protein BP00DRAFT_475123 [Aspergillus indologenus CBS 114.80]|uniref:RTA1-domain-containing protein n=1 Tax=Aspergillus indologenus CBS 114.80 TaxID=1450541 RepID=A0A2V5J2S5_9EURO|nr:hypothetical protein BP00DRAFT_475123 [Aspergillus indologenus CBS 114.80]